MAAKGKPLSKAYDGVAVVIGNERNAILSGVAGILRRQIAKRCGPYVVHHFTEERQPLSVELALDKSLPLDGFRLEEAGPDALRVAGADERGVLYGVGRFLRDAEYRTGWFTPGAWRGSSSPRRPVRGVYFATHGQNWYERAPIESVQEYLTEIALWGVNAIMFWYCMHDFLSPDTVESRRMVERLKSIARHAQSLGLKVYTGGIVNEGFSDTPGPLRAERNAANGYFAHPVAWFDGQVCPAKPGGRERILVNRRAMLDLFSGVALDGFFLWPYDQGGCTCAACAPWGANGMLRLAPDVAECVRRRYPNIRFILSTWEFDKFTHGEFEGLDRALAGKKPDWADYLLAEDHGGRAPEYILRHGVPGGLPFIGFPEISMWGIEPWGGYGAICCPTKLQNMWDGVRHLSQGGFPYSEGPFEDVNKAICARFYWDDQSAEDTLGEYACYEFGHGAADEGAEIMRLLERSFPRTIEGRRIPLAYRIGDTQSVEEAWRIVEGLDRRLPAPVRRAWRWRLIYLRGLIDHELAGHDFHVSERAEEALNELTEIYCFGPESNYCMDPQRVIRHGKPRPQ